jgi:hypothetical protein
MSISPDEITFVLQALEEEGGKHYDVRCTRCRHTNRVSLERLRQEAAKIKKKEEPKTDA